MKNHYIPCFYTQRWTDNSRKLVIFTLPFNELVDRRRYPVQVGYEKDLYTLPGIYDETKFQLENRFFRQIDQKASDVLYKIEQTNIPALSESERGDWATFLISLRQRNPEKLAEIGLVAEAMFNSRIDEYRHHFEAQRSKGDTSTFEEFVSGLREDRWFERTNKLLVESAILIPDSTAALISFVWNILRFQSPDHELLTSDRPLMMTDGIDGFDGHVALPIGPRKLFIAARHAGTIENIARLPGLTTRINDLAVRQASKEVYSTSTLQRAFIERRLRLPM